MNQFLLKQWQGNLDINADITDFGSAKELIDNKHNIYCSSLMYTKFFDLIFNLDRSNETHGFKYHVWKNSMKTRYWTELIFQFFLTLFFQIYISQFNFHLHLAQYDLEKMIDSLDLRRRLAGTTIDPHDISTNLDYNFDVEAKKLMEELHITVIDLFDALLLSGCNFLFPIFVMN